MSEQKREKQHLPSFAMSNQPRPSKTAGVYVHPGYVASPYLIQCGCLIKNCFELWLKFVLFVLNEEHGYGKYSFEPPKWFLKDGDDLFKEGKSRYNICVMFSKDISDWNLTTA